MTLSDADRRRAILERIAHSQASISYNPAMMQYQQVINPLTSSPLSQQGEKRGNTPPGFVPYSSVKEAFESGVIKKGVEIRTNAYVRSTSDKYVVQGVVNIIDIHNDPPFFCIDDDAHAQLALTNTFFHGPNWQAWAIHTQNTEGWIEVRTEVASEGGKKSKPRIDFDSVIVSPEKKEQILAAIAQHEHNDTIFNKWGFGEVLEKGKAVALLFYGPPGTGKTLMAEAISEKMGQKLLIVGPAEIETSTPGGAERNIKRFFKIASGLLEPETGEKDQDDKPIKGKKEKHVLLFDECDSLITNRDKVGVIMRGQINTLLSELERYEGTVVFTTNAISTLDPAMERRITSKVEFEFPDQDAREKIWRRMIPKKAPLDKSVDLSVLASFPFAGGNIKNIVLNAARTAAFKGNKKITLKNFLEAMKKEEYGMKAFEATKRGPYLTAADFGEVRSDTGIARSIERRREEG